LWGDRERWRMCGVVRPRRRLPLRPFPCPRPVDRFATARRCPERVRNAAHPIPRSGCCWRDQREDLGVGPSVRVTIQEAHPLAWSIACGGLRVGRTRRGQHGPWQRAARSCSSKAQRAAAAVHVVHGTWWRAAGGERAAGRRRRTSARHPSTRAACVHALRAAARVQVAKGSACAECEMRRRRAAGRRRRTSARDPSTRAALHGTWWRAVRTGSNEGQAHSSCPGSGSQSEREAERERGFWRWPPRYSNTWYPHVPIFSSRATPNRGSRGNTVIVSWRFRYMIFHASAADQKLDQVCVDHYRISGNYRRRFRNAIQVKSSQVI